MKTLVRPNHHHLFAFLSNTFRFFTCVRRIRYQLLGIFFLAACLLHMYHSTRSNLYESPLEIFQYHNNQYQIAVLHHSWKYQKHSTIENQWKTSRLFGLHELSKKTQNSLRKNSAKSREFRGGMKPIIPGKKTGSTNGLLKTGLELKARTSWNMTTNNIHVHRTGGNPFRTAVSFCGQLETNDLEFDWCVPKTGLELYKG